VATGGGLVDFGSAGFTGNVVPETVLLPPPPTPLRWARAPCSMCFLLRLAARFRLGSLGVVGTTGVPAGVAGVVTARFSLDFLLRLGNVAYLSSDLTMSYVLTNFLTVDTLACFAAAFRSVFFGGSALGGLFLAVSK